MAKRPCAEPGCPALGTSTRCPAHTKGTTERGYGWRHQQERAKWQLLIDRGGWPCARCPGRIQPDDEWHLDHSDGRTTYLGPSHAHCNTSAGGKARHQQ